VRRTPVLSGADGLDEDVFGPDSEAGRLVGGPPRPEDRSPSADARGKIREVKPHKGSFHKLAELNQSRAAIAKPQLVTLEIPGAAT
jgi:hypothetical protein